MGKKTPPPKPPDLSPISDAQLKIADQSNQIALKQLGLSEKQFDFFMKNSKEELALARSQADKLFGLQQKAFDSDQEAKAFAQKVGQKQIDAMDLQMEYAKKDRQRYEDVFLPMQDQFIDEAKNYDTPERREAQAAQAMGDIQRQAEAQRANADQRLQSMGIDPSQVRSQSLMNQMGVATAANQAMAGNQSRQMVEDKGRALRADAINLGMGLPAQSTQNFASAGASGQGAIGAGMASQTAQLGALQGGAGMMAQGMGFRSQALNNVAQLTGSPMAWAQMGGNMMGQSLNGYSAAGNTMSQNFNNQMQSWQAGQQQAQQNFQNVMSVAGMAAGMMMAEGGAVRTYSEGDMVIDKVALQGGPKADLSAALKDPDLHIKVAKRSGGGSMSHDPGNQYKDNPVTPTQMTQLQGNTNMSVDYEAEGGRIRPRGAIPVRQSRDNIPAWLTEGEYVIPRDVTQALGLKFFDNLVKKYHRENS